MAFSTGKTAGNKQAQQVSPEGHRRRRAALLLLILLLMIGSYLLGRDTYQPPAPAVDFETPTLAPAPSTAPPAPTPSTVVPPPMATAPAPATTPVAPAASLTLAAATEAPPVTALLEVSVGTRNNGGLSLKFDHPVSWTVSDNIGKGDAQVDIQGVHNLDTFPRNLPLPPGVRIIHAGIVDADTLHLRFTLRQGVRAITAPADGPSPVLSLFFRTAAEGYKAPALPPSIQATGGCGAPSATSSKAIALLQRSLDKNPTYADVRTALTLLETCIGDGSRAELLLTQSLKTRANSAMRITAADAALRFARGDAAGALQVLKANAADAVGDPGYAELMADIQAAAH
ncbi:MAG TPA: hypothetical protein VGM47_08200 [Gammaproteobacteria bacterium]|jgi:hypothetical protein